MAEPEDDNVCPYADDGHETEDPYGGPCHACWERVEEDARRDYEDNLMEGMRRPWDG